MWSEELQKLTKEHFKKMPMAAMKHIDGRFGICFLKDDKYIIGDREDNTKEYIFDSIDAFIKDGWAID